MKRIAIGLVIAVVVLVCAVPVFASMFGEENVTLMSILAELVDSSSTLADISDTAGKLADMSNELVQDYQRVNAAIDGFKNSSFDAFLSDLQRDFSKQYPGFAKLEYATEHFDRWKDTHTRSPVTAYEGISAVAADLSAPLRRDLAARRTNIDRELILASEASSGFAAAETADNAADLFSDHIEKLGREAKDASPGHAQQVSAQASVLLLEQQSHVMRLLSRVLRMNSVAAAVDYGTRISARNAHYERQETVRNLADAALQPPTLMSFGDL